MPASAAQDASVSEPPRLRESAAATNTHLGDTSDSRCRVHEGRKGSVTTSAGSAVDSAPAAAPAAPLAPLAPLLSLAGARPDLGVIPCSSDATSRANRAKDMLAGAVTVSQLRHGPPCTGVVPKRRVLRPPDKRRHTVTRSTALAVPTESGGRYSSVPRSKKTRAKDRRRTRRRLGLGTPRGARLRSASSWVALAIQVSDSAACGAPWLR